MMSQRDLSNYYESFSTFMRSGDQTYLEAVFPDDASLALASVYRNGFMRSCIDALKSNYPVVLSLVGEEFFVFLAQQYIAEYPPKSGTLVGYGQDLPAYIDQQKDKHDLLYLSGIAELDKAWLDVYFSPDTESLSADSVSLFIEQGAELTDLPLSLVSAVRVVETAYCLSQIWTSLKQGEALGEGVHLVSEPESLLIWRDQDDQILLEVLSPPEVFFIHHLQREMSLGSVAAQLLTHYPEVDVVGCFSQLLERGVLRSSLSI